MWDWNVKDVYKRQDCGLTGQDPEGSRDPYLVTENDSQNDTRIRNLASMAEDGDWHYFYMIGKNYEPRTEVLGEMADMVYSRCV